MTGTASASGLRVVGAGLGRTGTSSLKLALERLLGAPCYHMFEVFSHLEDHVPLWREAVDGTAQPWDEIFEGYAATVDFPAAVFWRELAQAYPDAIVLLSVRDSPETWWRSADATIFEVARREPPPELADWAAMWRGICRTRFTERIGHDDGAFAMEAYERHNEAVRAGVPADRLVEWQPGDGWGPLCDALGVAVPDEPFPHTNTTSEFRAMVGWE